MIDVAIVGGGPAGLSAAINIASRNKTPVIFSNKRESSWLYKAEDVNNHLGMPHMTGEEMINKFYSHTTDMDIEIREGRVLQILSMGDYYTINFENEFVNARAVIVATGIQKGKAVKGENELVGKGVSYCATCDGMLYRGKTVMVISDTEEGIEDANFLSEVCKKVYFVPRKGVAKNLNEKIEVLDGEVTHVIGDEFVTGAIIKDKEVLVDGVFFVKAEMPSNSLITGIEMDGNSIKVNRLTETNLKGLFSAGDCTGWPFQVSNAIGEGLVAGQQAVRYVVKMLNK